MDPAPLPAAWYARPAETVARELLGALLVSEVGGVRVTAEIVETEAYVGPEDEASHAAERFGRTARNDAMFAAAGTAYVYLIYGMHWCLNVVTGDEGFGAAVLIRAARTIDGIEHARARRPGRPDRELMRGPGNLARALGVDGALNYHPMDRPPLWISPGRQIPDAEVAVGPRIGITRAADWPLRFWLRGEPHVSGRA
ncbi:MAG TPA: DNA-3-methyladenine glycosylase [Longimicrobium sp.]|nr:DNA-3-methyladenine glycosylase [Longimicrobium sp.]